MPYSGTRLDDVELMAEIQKVFPEFPVPRSWQFKQSFNLSLIAIGASIVGVILSLLALYLAIGKFPIQFLGLPTPVLFALGVFTIEFFGLNWIGKKSRFVEPPAELYMLTLYSCSLDHSPDNSTFFSEVRAVSELLNQHPLTEYHVPVTYRLTSPLYAMITPRGIEGKHRKVKIKTSLRKRFRRWYWYRANTINVIFKQDTVKIAQITQHLNDYSTSVGIDFYAFDNYWFEKYPLPEDVNWFETVNGKVLLAKRVFFKDDFTLDSIIFSNGKIWPPERDIFSFLVW